MDESYSIVCVCYIYSTYFLSIHLLMDIYVLVIINRASMNMGVNVSFQIMVLSGYMSRCGIARSFDDSSFLRNLHTAFHGGCPNLHPH